MENYSDQNAINVILITGTAFCMMALVFIFLIIIRSRSMILKQRQHFDFIQALLLAELKESQGRLTAQAKQRKDFTEIYLEHILYLLKTVDKYELIASGEFKAWEKELISIYNTIQAEIKQLSLELFAENKEGMNFISTIGTFIRLYNETKETKIHPVLEQSNQPTDYNILFPAIRILSIIGEENPGNLHINDHSIKFDKTNSQSMLKVHAVCQTFGLEYSESDKSVVIGLK